MTLGRSVASALEREAVNRHATGKVIIVQMLGGFMVFGPQVCALEMLVSENQAWFRRTWFTMRQHLIVQAPVI